MPLNCSNEPLMVLKSMFTVPQNWFLAEWSG